MQNTEFKSPYDPYLTKQIIDQNESRVHWNENQNDQDIEGFMRTEYAEFLEAREMCMLGDDPFSLVSEAGDMGYLYIRRRFTNTPIPADIVDMMIDVERTLAEVGMSMEECLKFKAWRNDYKYPHVVTNNGYMPEKASKIAKEFWQYMGGDKVFYYAYMMMADII